MAATIPTKDKAARATLRILATSDVHMHLSGFDDTTQKPSTGLARLAPLIREQRSNAPDVALLVDNGDALQGTPLALAAHEGNWDETHPLATVMRSVGYDVMGLGNHDFDLGVSYLEAICGTLPCPVLSANTQGLSGIHDRVILTQDLSCDDGIMRPIRIGVTSALPSQTGEWIAHVLEDLVQFDEPLDSLKRAVEALKSDGADLILVLAHGGFELNEKDTENFARGAAQIVGVDAIIAGHAHLVFPNCETPSTADFNCETGHVNGRPCVMPGFGANCLGQIDLDLVLDATGIWKVAHSTADILFPDPASIDEDILDRLTPARAALAAKGADIIGETKSHLHSYFAMLRPNPLFGLLGQAMVDALDGLGLPANVSDLPRLAAIAPTISGGRAGSGQYVDIAPGPVRRQALGNLCPYEDVLVAKVVSGADLRLHLERAAAIFTPLQKGSGPQVLLDWDMPCFCFDMIFGLSVEIDPGQRPSFSAIGAEIDPQAHRITKMDWQGQPVADEMQFLLAMTSYRASGGGGYPNGGTLVQLAQPAPSFREVIKTALAGSFSGAQPDWRLRSQNGHEVVYETSPQAADHLDDIAEFMPEQLGLTPEGFLRLKLRL